MKLVRRFNLVERSEIVEKSQQCLWTPEGSLGLDYLHNHRKLEDSVIREFKIGYIPRDVKHQLSGRIIMPVIDPSGNIVAISSRRVDDSDTRLPVYWHESYEKSFYLYGIRNAISSMRQWGFAVVVEGQFDVLQMHNRGMKNAVGLGSTNLSDVQISIIHRYCDEIVLLLDCDENMAGQKGVKKALSKTSFTICTGKQKGPAIGYKVLPVGFQEHTDPDEFIQKHGIRAMKQLIKKPLVEMRRKKWVST